MSKALAFDDRDAELSDADEAMLRYADRLTRAPASITAGDVDELRAVGFSDTAVLDICQIVSYYNYVNRLADGLGVRLEERWEESDLTMTPVEFEEQRARRAAERGDG